MQNLRIALAIIITTSLLSCGNNKQDKFDLSSDKDLCEIFNATEIESLSSMVEFVDKTVIDITSNENEADAYHDFFEAYKHSLRDSSKRIVPINEKEKYKFLESLNKGLFEAIWQFDTHHNRIKYKDSILTNVDYIKSLTMNPSGRYIKYLELVGKRDERYKDAYELIRGMGDFPASQGWPLHKDFDFNKVENRIFATIIILRIEETYESKLNRYFQRENSTHNNLE